MNKHTEGENPASLAEAYIDGRSHGIGIGVAICLCLCGIIFLIVILKRKLQKRCFHSILQYMFFFHFLGSGSTVYCLCVYNYTVITYLLIVMEYTVLIWLILLEDNLLLHIVMYRDMALDKLSDCQRTCRLDYTLYNWVHYPHRVSFYNCLNFI